MGKSQRSKGARGELEAVHKLKTVYPKACRGTRQWDSSTAAPDVENTPWWPEVKRGKRVNIKAAMRQAEKAAKDAEDKRPVIAWTRDDGCTEMVTMWGPDWLNLVEELEQLRGKL